MNKQTVMDFCKEARKLGASLGMGDFEMFNITIDSYASIFNVSTDEALDIIAGVWNADNHITLETAKKDKSLDKACKDLFNISYEEMNEMLDIILG